MENKSTDQLLRKIQELEKEVELLKSEKQFFKSNGPTVSTPEAFAPPFEMAQKTVAEFFKTVETKPEEGTITINGERYVLMRANALSYDFLNSILEMYADRGETAAYKIGRNLLFDFAHVIGKEDAAKFHTKMNLTDPLSKLSAGPVHFAYTGWAFVDILPESNPAPDDNYYLKYHHPYSFEADSWIRKGELSKYPVCSMNAGYSSGWCEESYGIELTAVEISCKAKGDEHCTFIMAPPHRIEEYLSEEEKKGLERHDFDVPLFFERKKVEETIQKSLKEKVMLLQEVHHRVKNNLQIVSSLLSLQSTLSEHELVKSELRDSRDRIKAMALLHETLYASDNIGKIDPIDYFNSVVKSLTLSYSGKNQKIETNILVDEEIADVDMDFAIPCGLIINELVSNAHKYAFPDHVGNIDISLKKQEDDSVELIVKDDGIGLPENLNPEQFETLGLQLVYLLAEQMNGNVVVKNNPGAEFRIDLKSVNELELA